MTLRRQLPLLVAGAVLLAGCSSPTDEPDEQGLHR